MSLIDRTLISPSIQKTNNQSVTIDWEWIIDDMHDEYLPTRLTIERLDISLKKPTNKQWRQIISK